MYAGCSGVLPHWEEEPICLLESRVERGETRRHTVTPPGRDFQFTFRGVPNTRTFIIQLMDKLVG